MMKTMMNKLEELTSRVDRLAMKEQHPAGNASVEEDQAACYNTASHVCTQAYPHSKDEHGHILLNGLSIHF